MSDIKNEDSVSEWYFCGLFDSRASVNLEINACDANSIGYRVNPHISIPTYSSIHAGLISSYLHSNDIGYILNDNDNIIISDRSAINSLSNHLRGKIIAKAEQLTFLSDSLFALFDNGRAHSPRGIISMLEGFEAINPRWAGYKNRKYTAQFISSKMEEMFDINTANIEPLSAPDDDYPTSPSDQYFIGFIDNSSRFTISIKKSPEYKIGYSAHPSFKLTGRWVGPRLNAYIEEFLNELPVKYSMSDDFQHLDISITNLDSLETLIEKVGPDLFIQYPQAEFLFEQGIPAFRDGYHHTKQGLYELVSVFENIPTTRISSRRKYTSDYFEELWGNKLNLM